MKLGEETCLLRYTKPVEQPNVAVPVLTSTVTLPSSSARNAFLDHISINAYHHKRLPFHRSMLLPSPRVLTTVNPSMFTSMCSTFDDDGHSSPWHCDGELIRIQLPCNSARAESCSPLPFPLSSQILITFIILTCQSN